jgi:hygromycin-B 4-O-kinase
MLRDELQRRMGAIWALVPVAEGLESQAFGFRCGADAFVLRVNRDALGFAKDAFAHQHFARAELPVPEVVLIGVLDDGNAYCVSRRVSGMTLQELGPSELPAVLEPVAQAMAAIAASDVAATSGFGRFDANGVGSCETWQGFLTGIVDSQRYDWGPASKHAGMERVARLLDTIAELAGHCREIRQLVHGDFGSNNVLTDGRRVTGVIDWSEAMIGDPLYDVANILFWRSWLECMAQQAAYLERQPMGDHGAKRLRCYQLRIAAEEIYQGAIAGDDRMVAWAISRCDQIEGEGRA